MNGTSTKERGANEGRPAPKPITSGPNARRLIVREKTLRECFAKLDDGKRGKIMVEEFLERLRGDPKMTDVMQGATEDPRLERCWTPSSIVAAGESELGERGSVFGAVHDERERSEEADEEDDQGANAEEGVEEEEGRRQREEFSTRLNVEEKREESGERKFGAE